MQTQKNLEAISLHVTDELTVTVLPSTEHEFFIPTKDVANGYGISPETVRSHLSKNPDEFMEGKHFIRNVEILHSAKTGGSTRATMWTKSGVIRLGFFIKSERARLFRDWAENLVLAVIGHKQPKMLPAPPKRKHNRITPERMIRIMSKVCRISDDALRMEIINELTEGGAR